MDPYLWRTVSYVFTFIGTAFVLVGGVGSWYFGNLYEKIAPFKKPVHMAKATVQIIIDSDEQINTTYADRGGYLILANGQTALLITSATECKATQIGNNRVRFAGVFTMDADDTATKNTVFHLASAEYAEFTFSPMPENAKIFEGKAVVIVNNDIRFEIPIPEQNANNGIFITRDLSGVFRNFPKHSSFVAGPG